MPIFIRRFSERTYDMKFAIIGLGGRGSTYAHFINYYKSELVAVCDTDLSKLELAKSYGVKEDLFFTSEDEFFEKGKLVYDCPTIGEIRENCAAGIASLWSEVTRFENPHKYYVDLSHPLWNLRDRLIKENKAALGRK